MNAPDRSKRISTKAASAAPPSLPPDSHMFFQYYAASLPKLGQEIYTSRFRFSFSSLPKKIGSASSLPSSSAPRIAPPPLTPPSPRPPASPPSSPSFPRPPRHPARGRSGSGPGVWRGCTDGTAVAASSHGAAATVRESHTGWQRRSSLTIMCLYSGRYPSWHHLFVMRLSISSIYWSADVRLEQSCHSLHYIVLIDFYLSFFSHQ